MASTSYNRNPSGNNQYGAVLKADDEVLICALEKYHRELLSSNKKIAARLAADHGIIMSERTVKRRRKELGLTGSGKTTKQLPEKVKEQLVLDQMDQDPARRSGVISTQHKIAFTTGTHLTREYVSSIMHRHDPEGFDLRDPTAKRVLRIPKCPIGIHERWAGDGHDKLYKIGFPVWAVVDDATSTWIGAWIVPSNRMGSIIGYLFLCLVEKFNAHL
ncbi:hypothetical protein BD779DRAFT_1472147 [Infundibulicybe gibba]|nr:hypothetical protein BD779DRAFT_1472147 [Infundibulicybe gibba]